MDKKFYYPQDDATTQYRSKHNYYEQSDADIELSSDRLDDMQTNEVAEQVNQAVVEREDIREPDNDDDNSSISKDLACLWTRKQQQKQPTNAEPKSPYVRSSILNDMAYGYRNLIQSLDADADKQEKSTNDVAQKYEPMELPFTSAEIISLQDYDPLLRNVQQDGVRAATEHDVQSSLGGTSTSLKYRNFDRQESSVEPNTFPDQQPQRLVTGQTLTTQTKGQNYVCLSPISDTSSESTGGLTAIYITNSDDGQSNPCDDLHCSIDVEALGELRHQYRSCSNSLERNVAACPMRYRQQQESHWQHSENTQPSLPERERSTEQTSLGAQIVRLSVATPYDPEVMAQSEPEFQTICRCGCQAEPATSSPYTTHEPRKPSLWSQRKLKIAARTSPYNHVEQRRREGCPNFPLCQSTTARYQSDNPTPMPEDTTQISLSANTLPKPLVELWTRDPQTFSACSTTSDEVISEQSSETEQSAISIRTCHFSSSAYHAEVQPQTQRANNTRLVVEQPQGDGETLDISVQDTASFTCTCECCRKCRDCHFTAGSRLNRSTSYTTYGSRAWPSYQTVPLPTGHQAEQQSSAVPIPHSCHSQVKFHFRTIAEAREESALKAGIVVLGPVRRHVQPTEYSQEEEQIEEKQIEEKQIEEKQLEEKQIEEKQIQEKQMEEKQMEEKQIQEKQIEEEQLEEKQTVEKPQKQNKLVPNHIRNKSTLMTYQSQFPPTKTDACNPCKCKGNCLKDTLRQPHDISPETTSRSSQSAGFYTAREGRPEEFAAAVYPPGQQKATRSVESQTHLSPTKEPKEKQQPPVLTDHSEQSVYYSARETTGRKDIAETADSSDYHTAQEASSMMALGSQEMQSPVLVKLQISESTVLHNVMHVHYRPATTTNTNRLQAQSHRADEFTSSADNMGMRWRRSDNSLPSVGQEAFNVAQKVINESTDAARDTEMLSDNKKSDDFTPMPLSSRTEIIKMWQSIDLLQQKQAPLEGGLYSQTHRLQFLPIDMLHADTAGGPIFEGDQVQHAMERSKYFEQEFDKLSGEEITEDLLLRLRQIRTLQNTAETHYEPHLRGATAGGVYACQLACSVRHSCPLGQDKCPTLLNGELLAHFCRAHLKEHLNLEVKTVYEDDSILIIFNPTSFRLATNTCMSILMYGGRDDGDDSKLPLKRFMPVGNGNLPEAYACYAGHLPIIVMICRNKLSAVCGKLIKFNQNENEDEDEDVFALWVVTMDLPRPMHMMMTVFNRRLDISRSNIMLVRGLSKSHNCAQFMNASRNYMRLSENDMKVLSNGYTEPVYIELTVKEYPDTCFTPVSSVCCHTK